MPFPPPFATQYQKSQSSKSDLEMDKEISRNGEDVEMELESKIKEADDEQMELVDIRMAALLQAAEELLAN